MIATGDTLAEKMKSFELFACLSFLQNRRMKWKKENKTKLDGPDMDESPESN